MKEKKDMSPWTIEYIENAMPKKVKSEVYNLSISLGSFHTSDYLVILSFFHCPLGINATLYVFEGEVQNMYSTILTNSSSNKPSAIFL